MQENSHPMPVDGARYHRIGRNRAPIWWSIFSFALMFLVGVTGGWAAWQLEMQMTEPAGQGHREGVAILDGWEDIVLVRCSGQAPMVVAKQGLLPPLPAWQPGGWRIDDRPAAWAEEPSIQLIVAAARVDASPTPAAPSEPTGDAGGEHFIPCD